MNRPTLLLFAALSLTIGTKANNSSSEGSIISVSPFEFEASYIGDFYCNATGGIKTGVGFLGMANLKVGFNTEAAGWWKGGSFFINGASTHGKSPTENFTGDFQVVSNIDAGDLIYLHELWFHQDFSKINFTIGLQDMNAQFVASENGSYYLNSSFGVPPVISDNVPVPIFPLTGLGLSASWTPSEKVTWSAAIFDGNPTDFEDNPHNLYWDLNPKELLGISEIQFTCTSASLPGTYKVGAYFHTGTVNPDNTTSKISHNYGFYLLADQQVWQNSTATRKLNLFAQLAGSPGKLNNHNYYLGGGANYYGLYNSKFENVTGIAFANAGFHKGIHKHETVIECFHKMQCSESISLQPDFQYIINPAGADDKLNDAFIGFLRLGIQF